MTHRPYSTAHATASSSSTSSAQATSGGIGFVGLLTVLFIALKLLDIIDWAWVWVLAPLWIPAAIGIGFLIIIGALAFIIDRNTHGKGQIR